MSDEEWRKLLEQIKSQLPEKIVKEGEVLRDAPKRPAGLLENAPIDAEFREVRSKEGEVLRDAQKRPPVKPPASPWRNMLTEPIPNPQAQGNVGALMRIAPWLMLLESTNANEGEDELLKKLLAPKPAPTPTPSEFPSDYPSELPAKPIKLKQPEESLLEKLKRGHFDHIKSIEDIRRRRDAR